jgi:chromate reductase, NAD(P)H dehydrogenase (quinone)
MSTSIHIVGISGSLRKGSYNTSLLHATAGLLPAGVTMDIVGIGDLPLYNGDLDLPIAKERPAAVQQFREALAKSDGLLIASPEYNYGIPGVLKNAIDWASRGEDSPLLKKPVAIMGASVGQFGTVRMQLDFQNIFLYLNMKPVYKPEVLIGPTGQKFDDKGNLTDEKARELIQRKLQALQEAILAGKQ